MRRVLWLVGGLLLTASMAAPFARDELLALAHGVAERNDGTELADKLVSPESVLDYVAAHPAQAALVSWELGQEARGIYVNADRPQPLAAGAHLLLLAAYAEQLAVDAQRGDERVPLAAWERYVLPDGDDAHHAALQLERALGVLEDTVDAGEAASVPLTSVVRALVRQGDPAAADLLLSRLGRASIHDLARRAGFAPDALPVPLAALPLSWLVRPPSYDAPHGPQPSSQWSGNERAAELLARYHALGPQRYTDAAWEQLARVDQDAAYARALRKGAARDSESLSLSERAQLAAALPPGAAARPCAALLGRLAASQLPGSETVRGLLESPLYGHDLAQLGRLRGSAPGVSASLSYVRDREGSIKVLALLFRDLPIAVWLRLRSGSVLQRFESQLLSDDDFFAHARQRFLPEPERQAAAEADLQRP